ncbi:MAG: hypothetical protein DLM55_01050 [Acidimicrobiales bacterium]|nr:MAG: hypothetical protein DLM55_01050 [Acidimicrobiales bacterium]
MPPDILRATADGEPEAAASLPVAALIATGWAVLAVLAPLLSLSLLAWVADSRSTAPAPDAVRLALDFWLAAHGVPLLLEQGSFRFLPLLVTAFMCWQLGRAGATTARAVQANGVAAFVRVGTAIGVWYAAAGAAAAVWGQLPSVHATPWVATAVFAAVALVCGVVGAVLGTASGRELLGRVPALIADVFRASASVVILIAAAAALLTVIMLAVSARGVIDTLSGYSLGVIGGMGMLLLCLIYLPTMMLWTAAYVVGPGFAVGAGTLVSIHRVEFSSLPAFPLLAAVPTTPGSVTVQLLMAIPAIAGVFGGAQLSRKQRQSSARALLLGAALVGVLSGMVLGGVAFLASGSLGDGRLADFGPLAWQVAVVTAASIAAGSVLGAVIHRWLVPRVLRLFPGPIDSKAAEPVHFP